MSNEKPKFRKQVNKTSAECEPCKKPLNLVEVIGAFLLGEKTKKEVREFLKEQETRL